MVSVQNPFDENGPGDLNDLPPGPPSQPSMAADDGESARTRPARGSSKSGPVARASDEASRPRMSTPARGQTPPSPQTPVAAPDDDAFVVNPGAPTLLMPAVNPDEGGDTAGPITPVLPLSSATRADDVEAIAGPARALSPVVRKAIVAGLAFSVVAVLVLAVVAVSMSGGESASGEIAQAVLTSSGEAPTSLVVSVDGVEVARALPAALPLSPDAPHVVTVTADGFEDFEMALPPLGAGVMQPIAVALRPRTGEATAVATASPAVNGDAKPQGANEPADAKKPDEPADAKKPDEPVDAKKPDEPVDVKKPDAAEAAADNAVKTSAAAPTGATAPAGDTAPTGATSPTGAETPLPASDDKAGWRLSFATIERGERRPIHGAEVIREGVLIGRTPFEQEFPLDLSKVVLRIKAEGFVAKDVEFGRGDETIVGPATVALTSVSSVSEGDNAARAPGESDEKPSVGSADAKPVDDAEESPGAGGQNESSAGTKKVAAKNAEKPDEKTAKTSEVSDRNNDDKASGKSESASAKKAEKREPARQQDADKKPERDKKSASEKSDKRTDDKKDDKKADTKKGSAETATLAIGTRPPAEIFIDKKSLGMAPLMGPKAPTVTLGKHFIVLKEPKSGKKVMLEVNVTKADSKAKIIYRFDDDDIDAQGVAVKKK